MAALGLEVTSERIDLIIKSCIRRNIDLLIKIWEDEVSRDSGEPCYINVNSGELEKPLIKFLFENSSFEEGGCIELLTKEGENLIFHEDRDERYISSSIMNDLGIEL